MLSPTSGVTLADYLAAIKNGNQTHARLVFPVQNITLDDDDIAMDGGITLTDIINPDTDLTMGKAVARELVVYFLNSDTFSGFNWKEEFRLDFGVEISGVTKWVTAGYFTGKKPDKTLRTETIEFTAYDRMESVLGRYADDFVSGLTFPCTMDDIYDDLCTAAGIDNVAGDEISGTMNKSFTENPFEYEGLTYRDILAWIAEANSCYAKVTADGKVRLCWFADHTDDYSMDDSDYFSVNIGEAAMPSGKTWDDYAESTWDDLSGYTWDQIMYYSPAEFNSIFAIWLRNPTTGQNILYPDTYSGDTGIYTIVENPLLEGTSSAVATCLEAIYNRMTRMVGYTPMTVSSIGNWMIESGDVILVDTGDKTYRMPVFARTLRWNGGCSDVYECTGTLIRTNTEPEADKIIRSSQLSGKYSIKSGVDITDEGVDIKGGNKIFLESGSSIDVKSGSKIDVASGGDIDIESGGDINVKSGGKIDVASGGDIDLESGGDLNVKSGGRVDVLSGGNIDIESGGNTNVKSGGKIDVKSGGDIDVESGGDINVKSGGNLNVASGGSIDIHATGTMELTGSTVSIKSGSTFNVDSTNFKISSADKEVVCEYWKLYKSGIRWEDPNATSGNIGYFGIHSYSDHISFLNNVEGLGTSNWFDFTKDGSIIPDTSDISGNIEATIGSSSNAWKWGYFKNLKCGGYQLISGTTSADMSATSGNPKLTFSEEGLVQPVHLIYSDFDSYRAPAGLKVIGGTGATPAWFEVEGDIYGRKLVPHGYSTSSTAASSYFTTGALEIRESGLVGDTQSDFAYAPRIGFHWANRTAATLSYNSNGIFYFRKQDGTTRATIDANINGGLFKRQTYSYTYSISANADLTITGTNLGITSEAGTAGTGYKPVSIISIQTGNANVIPRTFDGRKYGGDTVLTLRNVSSSAVNSEVLYVIITYTNAF